MFKCVYASGLAGQPSAYRSRGPARCPTRCASSSKCTLAPGPAGEPAADIQLSRRATILAATAATFWHRPAAAAETQDAEQAAAVQPPSQKAVEQAAAAKPPGQKGFKTFNEKDFVLEVPRGFVEQQSPAASDFGAGGRPKSTYERAAALTPLRVKFTSEDGQELLTVIQRNASELKQALFQITDISQLGSVTEVASVLLPREVQVLAADSVSLPQEPRDTGTVFGTLQLPPQTVYRYTFRTRGQRAHLVVVAKAGKVYLTAGSAREDRWSDASDRLKAAVVSFRLV